MPYHEGLSAGRWATLSLAEQLGNVGSEVDRAVRAWVRGDRDRFERAFDRALELFDLTMADPRWRGRRLREIARSREEFCRLFFGDDDSWRLVRGLQDYFLHFALAARMRRESESPHGTPGSPEYS